MLDWITSTINSLGYLGIALLMFVENIFPPSSGSTNTVVSRCSFVALYRESAP
jgi:membrane protein DedA with SNARE-associated domain